MSPDALPRAAVLGQLAQLAIAFGRQPDHGHPDQVATIYTTALSGMTVAALERGVQAAIREERYFPRPAVLRRYVLDAQALLHAMDRHEADDGDRCRQCGAHRWYAGFELPGGAVAPRLRCQCPVQGVGWETTAALAWTDPDGNLIHAGYVPPADDLWRRQSSEEPA